MTGGLSVSFVSLVSFFRRLREEKLEENNIGSMEKKLTKLTKLTDVVRPPARDAAKREVFAAAGYPDWTQPQEAN